ncbi:hypothetical protein DVS28_a2859 [Euzebya pacifica]|uniref:Uncharacterized protein n=1 Tax=Euzebya pacifica TaxID=1608957 RepID=A0A346XZ91_9ACTN|nr:hypothetical protein [Euzebya pacifica]AXV07538.1 hypothetical protein DVS28_a2859 [Euzebya pacifica]
MQTLTRRQLGLGGAAALAAAASSTLLQPAGGTTMRLGLGAMKPTNLRIGAILPTSPWDAELPRRLVAGLREALAAPGWLSTEIVERDVEGGIIGIQQAGSELLAEDVDVLLAVTNPLAADRVVIDASDAAVPLLVSTFGAMTARGLGRPEVPAVVHGLHMADAGAALGAWTVRHNGPRVGVLARDREAMFDLLSEFGRGVTSAGGTLVTVEVVHEVGQVADALDRMHAAGIDTLHLEVGGVDAPTYLDVVTSSSVAGLPRTAGPSAGDPGATSCASWGSGQDPAHQLGVETGSLLAAAVRRGRGRMAPMAGLSFTTERGTVSIDPRTGVSSGPVFLGGSADVVAVPPGAHGSLVQPVTGVLSEYGCF